jgi:hypothetical protein
LQLKRSFFVRANLSAAQEYAPVADDDPATPKLRWEIEQQVGYSSTLLTEVAR